MLVDRLSWACAMSFASLSWFLFYGETLWPCATQAKLVLICRSTFPMPSKKPNSLAQAMSRTGQRGHQLTRRGHESASLGHDLARNARS
jgi:hypothetical protein